MSKFLSISWVALLISVLALGVALYHWHNGGGKVHVGVKS